MDYIPASNRYEQIPYRRCGRSGILLPALSLGLWHNFGNITPFTQQQSILRKGFDLGITHFDLANNYGPPTAKPSGISVSIWIVTGIPTGMS